MGPGEHVETARQRALKQEQEQDRGEEGGEVEEAEDGGEEEEESE